MNIDLSKTIDLTNINWRSDQFGSSNGILPKTVTGNTFLKLGSYSKPFGFYGIEPIIEVINSRIGDIIGLNVLHYGLLRANVVMEGLPLNTLVSVSKIYRQRGKTQISLER